jgi:signal transduction histidine kinase
VSPAALVTSAGRIIRLYGAMDPFLDPPAGTPSRREASSAGKTLKRMFLAALTLAVRQNREIAPKVPHRNMHGHRVTLRLTVRPVGSAAAADRHWLMVFEELPARGTRAKKLGRLQQLRSDLRSTKPAERQVEEMETINQELNTLNEQLEDKVRALTAVNDDLANLLVASDVASVFLDTDLRIKRFTTGAAQLLNLLLTDIDQPVAHLASDLVGADFVEYAREVLETGAPIERPALGPGGQKYFLRVLPYRAADQTMQGVVLTLFNVTALTTIERELRDTKEQLSADLRRMSRLHEVSTGLVREADLRELLDDILAAAIEITEADMGLIQLVEPPGFLTIAAQHGFAKPFLDFFRQVRLDTDNACGAAIAGRRRLVVEDVITGPVFEGASCLNILRTARVRALQSTPLMGRAGQFVGLLSTHFRTRHHFTDSERQWLDLLARQAADLIVRRQTEQQLVEAQGELEHRVVDRTKWLTLMHDVTRAINDAPSWDEGLRQVLHRICETEHWQIGLIYLVDRDNPDGIAPVISWFDDKRYRPFHEASEGQRFTHRQSLPGRVYADGIPLWLNEPEQLIELLPTRREAATATGLRAAAALPIRFGRDVISVLELFSDRAHTPNEVLANLMNDVCVQIGKVLEREHSKAQLSDLIWREQQGLLHTLHDSLGQTLTGLGMLATGLSQRLRVADVGAVESATQIAHLAQQALAEVRLLSRNLFPLEIETESFLAALEQLALTTTLVHNVPVQVLGHPSEALRDGVVATQLYRIVQEALTNAVKHAHARTIAIQFGGEPGLTSVSVIDDGVGIQNAGDKHDGAGLGIMKYRASSIGGVLTVEAGTGGGTVVTCTVRGISPQALPYKNRPRRRQR